MIYSNARFSCGEYLSGSATAPSMGSGIPRVLDEWPQIDLISEITGNQFTAQVQRPAPQWQAKGEQVTEQVETERLESRLESKLAAKVVLWLEQEPRGKKELASRLGHRGVSGELHRQIRLLLAAGWIEMTLPDKPNSRLQQYRLTALGRQWLQESEQGKRHE
ncbi:Fic family protein [Methylobacillus sp.]|uniref:Fic family protein n=1 Tax=Methylobacillus sp. TaxID=56818 RepID=UPI002FE1FBE6